MSPTAVQRSSHLTAQSADSSRPPTIVSTRRMLDDRFPILGFNIYNARPGFGEVLLATDRTLFDPSGTGRRKPENFYSSRQDSRLIPIQFGAAVYLVPAAVLKGFARATPRPTEIYYTLIVYPGADGANGVFAQPPETLPASAPSVGLSRHFGSNGAHEVLGMSPERLKRFQPVAAQALSPAMGSVSPEDDLADGEDGTTAPPPDGGGAVAPVRGRGCARARPRRREWNVVARIGIAVRGVSGRLFRRGPAPFAVRARRRATVVLPSE